MYTEEDIRREYDRLDRICGVDTSCVEIVISRRSLKRLGSFRMPAPGGTEAPRITVSAALLEDEAQFWDTIRHEYAHAAVYLTHPGERHGHDGLWKEMCRRVGCTPKSTAPRSEELEAERRRRARYRIRCPACGAETYYLRAGKIVSLMERGYRRYVRCARCGGNRLELYTRE